MGIIPELGRAWVSVDNRLYLWDYNDPNVYTLYNGLSDVIVSVALASPKPGIFTDIVKYVLVVATTVEVVLLAVTWRLTCDGSKKELRLQNTQYTISTDNATIFKIVSSVSGRIFLAGNDRNLYELVYESDNNSWKSVLGIDAPYKCKKVSHSNWSLINILDPVFRVFGGAEDGLVDLAIDDPRNILYGVTATGTLSLYYLGRDGWSAISTASGFDIIAHYHEYIISRSSYSRNNIMSDPTQLKVTALHVIEPLESTNVHLIVSMTSGARVYLTVCTAYGKPVTTPMDVPQSFQIVSIRNPPSPGALGELMSAGDNDTSRVGVSERVQVPSVCSAYCSHGVDVYASFQNHRGNDVLVGIGTDYIVRRSGHTVSSEPLSSLTESLCIIECEPRIKRVYDIRESCPQLSDPSLSALRSLYSCSSSLPAVGSTTSSSSSNIAAYQWGFSSVGKQPSVVAGPPSAIPSSNWELGDIKCGLSREDLGSGIVAPLGELALQHGPHGAYPQRQILCLSNSGMHFLIKLRPVDYLFRMLSRSSSSSYRSDLPVDYLAHVSSFFESFGSLNACCMCFGLACGLPCDAGGGALSLNNTSLSVSAGLSTIQHRAISAVLRYSDVPSYTGNRNAGQVSENQTPESRQNLLLSGVSRITDPRVVSGASPVCYSACHNAIYLLTSRLLRPVWSKVLVGCKVTGKNIDGSDKKEFFLLVRRQELSLLMRPLVLFVRVLREYFGPTLCAAEAAHIAAKMQTSAHVTANPSDLKPGALVSKQMAVLDRTGNMSVSYKTESNPKENNEAFAKKQEDISIFRCFRLITRSLQALNLLDILSIANEEYAISIPWGNVSGVSFCNFVLSPVVQSRVKSLVHGVISKVSAKNADPLIALLDANCFMYFSVGDRLTFEASKLLDTASEFPLSDGDPTERDALISRATTLLLQACSYWQSLDYVQDGGDSSKLFKFCRRLRDLGTPECFDGIVDLTLKTANIFFHSPGTTSSTNSNKTLPLGKNDCHGEDIIADRGLYHGGGFPVQSDSDRENFKCCCYDVLLSCIGDILSLDEDGLGSGVKIAPATSASGGASLGLVFRMITRAASSNDDQQFHSLLYSCLMEKNKDMLVRLNTRFIENFLLEQDLSLTYSFYTFHGIYDKAAQLMDVRAHCRDDEVHLDDRIQDLGRAVSSAQRAVAACRDAQVSSTSALEVLNQLEEKLDIAELQRLVLTALSSKLELIVAIPVSDLSQEELSGRQLLEDIVHRLSDRLWPVSELYNQVTDPYELWDLSLIILHSCKHDDPELIRKLWMSIIYKNVPCRSTITVVQNFLEDKKKRFLRQKSRDIGEGNAVFEGANCSWMRELQSVIVDLGLRLCREHSAASVGGELAVASKFLVADFLIPTFPLPFLVEELEDIAALHVMSIDSNAQHIDSSYIERAWVAKCLQRVGVSHLALVEAYMTVIENSQGKLDEKKIQLLSSVSFIILEWTKSVSGYGVTKTFGAKQLLGSARSGTLRMWTDKIGQTLSVAAGSIRLLNDSAYSSYIGGVIEDIRSDVLEADHRVRSYLLG